MKQFIVMMAMLLLGVSIYLLIAGPDDGSITKQLGRLWQQELEFRSNWP